MRAKRARKKGILVASNDERRNILVLERVKRSQLNPKSSRGMGAESSSRPRIKRKVKAVYWRETDQPEKNVSQNGENGNRQVKPDGTEGEKGLEARQRLDKDSFACQWGSRNIQTKTFTIEPDEKKKISLGRSKGNGK